MPEQGRSGQWGGGSGGQGQGNWNQGRDNDRDWGRDGRGGQDWDRGGGRGGRRTGIEEEEIMIGTEVGITTGTGIEEEEDLIGMTGIDLKNIKEDDITIIQVIQHGGIHTGINGLHQY